MRRTASHRVLPVLAIASGLWFWGCGGSRTAIAPEGTRPAPSPGPLHRTIDLALGETAEIVLSDGPGAAAARKVHIKLVDVDETRDEVCGAVRRARVSVEVDGTRVELFSGNYHLPVTAGGVQIDSPVTRGYRASAMSYNGSNRMDPWGLDKDARLRVWPAGAPWLPPGTFTYPAQQRWFASMTHMANEPVFVDGGEAPGPRRIYYHYGLDMGGSEGLVDVVAATDGLVVSAGTAMLPAHAGTPVEPRYDVIYLQDARGWYYRYSHLKTIEVRLGERVRMGQKMGVLGKEGGSGGWSHLHFDITNRQPSGKWGIEEGYAFLWEAYMRQHMPKLIAVARPHQVVWSGSQVVLDGSRSWGQGLRYEWTFSDGTKASGARVARTYDKPGSWSEILKITDADGRVAYDFAIVLVNDRGNPKRIPHTVHPNYAPSLGIQPGDPVTFKVRTFRTQEGEEHWDFGDGSPAVTVKSDGNAQQHAPDGYAQTVHRFAKPGLYVVRVERDSAEGLKAIGHVSVAVGE